MVSHSRRGAWFGLVGERGEGLTEAWLLVLPSRDQLAWKVLLQIFESILVVKRQSRWMVC